MRTRKHRSALKLLRAEHLKQYETLLDIKADYIAKYRSDLVNGATPFLHALNQSEQALIDSMAWLGVAMREAHVDERHKHEPKRFTKIR